MSRHYGVHPRAWDAYQKALKDSHLPKEPKIMQVIGRAKASAGYHVADGNFTISGKTEPYCAAIDLSVKGFLGIGGYNERQIRWLLYNLARNGFVAWYRYRNSFNTNRHIHAVYAGVHMKPQLQEQVRSFLNDRDGLASRGKEVFWTAPPQLDAELKELFERFN